MTFIERFDQLSVWYVRQLRRAWKWFNLFLDWCEGSNKKGPRIKVHPAAPVDRFICMSCAKCENPCQKPYHTNGIIVMCSDYVKSNKGVNQ